MARSFEQVLAEVSKQSDPQRQAVLNQITQLPTQQAADESALAAKKDQAYSDILDGARRRGLGFAGIPLGEQAKYNATDYAPAVANLKSSYVGRKSTLESALADIGKQDYSSAYNIFNTDRQFEEQQRQFNEQLAEQRRQAAAASANVGQYFGGSTSPSAGGGVNIPAGMQQLYNQVFVKPSGGAWDDKALVSDYNATLKSAQYGNQRDKQKLELYHSVRPDLFGAAVPGAAFANGGSLRF